MLLAIDIGNTNITIGIFATSADTAGGNIPPTAGANMWRISSDTRRTADEYGTQILDFLHYSLINKEDITAVAVSTVVPALTDTINLAVKNYLKRKAVFLNYTHFVSYAGLEIDVDNPSEVGVDRLVNALAARELYKGRPAIVVDFGTAVTFDCVGINGNYLGGVILPGISAAQDALQKNTAKLPHVSISKPAHIIGKNTVECIQSGLWYGYIFITKNFISALRRELGSKTIVIGTGGGMEIFTKNDIKEIDIFAPTLTLEGIKIIWEKIAAATTARKSIKK